MFNNFCAEYAELTDDELLHLASDRASLTTEAATALDAELQRRKLTESDRLKHEQFVQRQERRESRRRYRKFVGTRNDYQGLFEVFCAVVTMAMIWIVYIALPSGWHMQTDWENAAVEAMFPIVLIAVVGKPWWRRITFWMSWAV